MFVVPVFLLTDSDNNLYLPNQYNEKVIIKPYGVEISTCLFTAKGVFLKYKYHADSGKKEQARALNVYGPPPPIHTFYTVKFNT